MTLRPWRSRRFPGLPLLAVAGLATALLLGCGVATGPWAFLALTLALSLAVGGCLADLGSPSRSKPDERDDSGTPTDTDPATDTNPQTDTNPGGDIGPESDTGSDPDGGGELDTDRDGIPDAQDDCPLVSDPDQVDTDHDGYGDVCDLLFYPSPCCMDECSLDSDGDGVPDLLDRCPWTPDPAQSDGDGDGVGDACDLSGDRDNDGIPDLLDSCPYASDPEQADSDGDGRGDACDQCPGPDALTPCGEWCCVDADGDGVTGGFMLPGGNCAPVRAGQDLCPFVADSQQEDRDRDGVGDFCDNCPDVPNVWQWDVDGDGVGDACSPRGTGEPPGPAAKPRTAPVRLPAPARLSAPHAALAPGARELQRRQLLGRLVGEGVLSAATFVEVHGGSPEQLRRELAGALRVRHGLPVG